MKTSSSRLRQRPARVAGAEDHHGTMQRGLRFLEMGMQTGQGDGCLSGVFGPAPDRGHQPRPAGNCLVPDVGTGQTYEQTPPVVGQRGETGHEAAALEVVGGEAAPAPLVLQLVKAVLAVTAAAVELSVPNRSNPAPALRKSTNACCQLPDLGSKK